MRCFKVNSTTILTRFDPNFYDPTLFIKLEGLNNSVFKLKKLGESIIQFDTGKNLVQVEKAIDTIPYYKTQNIRPLDIDTRAQYFVCRSELKTTDLDDLLFVRVGAGVGDCSHVTRENINAAFSDNVIRVKLKDEWISRYIAIFLSTTIGKNSLRRHLKGSGKPLISRISIENLYIPCPPKNIQHQIVAIMDKAHTQKRQKEAEAKALLDSIDDYVLGELGIELPEFENKMCFSVRASEVVGKRVDSQYYESNFSLTSRKYKLERLTEFCLVNPSVNISHLDENEQVSFVPMDAVSESGFIQKFETTVSSNSKGYTLFQENDLIIAKITPCMENGKTAIATSLKSNIGIGSTEFHVLRPKDSSLLDVNYLHTLFRTKLLRKFQEANFVGSSGHRRVPPQFFDDVKIPIPPIQIQAEIVEVVENRKKRAKTLIEAASSQLESAKSQVEKMILGEDQLTTDKDEV